ncbi:Di-copper centre-containing protein [Cryphonectria parasitica EP155]|uniref:tyrosinase n=1 Tax=Cryphonectria parasitica (strain ATCC 38755 / EP155) TaxID=660469 RepID=A0A9P4XX01_CRYP1|nr:Di-copper centre-containing protein [Cryphonectria parasitica EP155]KAF3762479.1 Di-copper centre-containing protein [Cryphonectria parasitica EP155]
MSPRLRQGSRICNLSIICCCMISMVLCTSYDYGFDVTKALKAKRQRSNTIVTTGMPLSADGSVPVRSEIRDLQQDANKWSLYILALDMMQYTDQMDPSSWFAITSIHGVPFQSWNGVLPTPGNENSGYCHHQDILFPTWHRAYVALYEQELCSRAQFIASLYSSSLRDDFEAAAADCRAPYLDWAAIPAEGDGILPASVGDSPTMNISGPAGVQTIANPLYTYAFNPPNSSVFFNITPWADWDSTRRAPPDESPDSPSNNSAVNQDLMSHMVQNQQRIYNLFSSYDNYTIFSNEGWAADTSQYDSLESLHDNVHSMLGGSDGHMTIVPFSAFDPVFFLHHCMIDRLLSLWQVMHPTAWIAPEIARYNSYTTSAGQVLEASTPLTPFYASSNGTFWDSDMLRDPTALGYTYPEMRSEYSSLPSPLRDYHKSYSYAASKRQSDQSLPVNRIISDQGQYREWIANIRAERQGLDGPFSIQLSFESSSSTSSSCHVGSMGVFASPPSVASLMQMTPGAQYISSTVPLTRALVDKMADGTISSLEPDEISSFLNTNLHVSASKSDGTSVDPDDVPGLGITIISALVQATSSEQNLPSWEEPDYQMTFL